MPQPTRPPAPRLVLFSGLGVGGALFRPQAILRQGPIRLHTPDWIDPESDETVEHYSARMAEGIAPRQPGEELFVGGLSFGGMVALEAARTLKPDGLFVMSSGFSHRVISPLVRPILAGAGFTTPQLLRRALGSLGLFVRLVGRPNRRQRRFLLGLEPTVNPRVCIWGGPALLRWAFRGSAPCPVYRIHGRFDHVAPLENAMADHRRHGGGPVHVLPGAGHALNVTHARELNDFLAATIAASLARTAHEPIRQHIHG